MLFFFFTKLDQMSRVGSRGRHPKCRPKNWVKEGRLYCLPQMDKINGFWNKFQTEQYPTNSFL